MIPTKAIVNDLSAFGPARSTVQGKPLSDEEARKSMLFGQPVIISLWA
jgi:hypothetical protein